MLLNIVTDEELLTSQIVKTILLIVAGAGIIYNIFRIVRAELKNLPALTEPPQRQAGKRNLSFIIFVILTVIIFFVFKEYRVEAALLKNPEYVQGTTVGFCNVFARGQGIEFEYEVAGQKFSNCNTFHPVSKDSIIVPGGKYMVRYSKKIPGAGRMNFHNPIK